LSIEQLRNIRMAFAIYTQATDGTQDSATETLEEPYS
jgi:hypothetical protein